MIRNGLLVLYTVALIIPNVNTRIPVDMITYPNAVDEAGNVHNINSITVDNRADHKYYCLGCDKEMVPVLCKKGKTPHFRHKVNDLCNQETYLHNLAKKYLAKQFESQPKFEVSYYATNDCPHKDSCQLFKRFQWKECFGRTLHTFDLKDVYDTCQVEGVYNGFRADVLLTSSKNSDLPPVFLEISVSHDCTPEKLQSGNRIIEMKIHSETDFKRPIVENLGPMVPVKEEPKPQYSYRRYSYHSAPEPSLIMFHHFDRAFHNDDLRKLDFFTILDNGKWYSEDQFLPCKYAGKKYLEASVFELGLLRGGFRGGGSKNKDLFDLGYTQALLHGQAKRHCIYCERYPRCTIPMEVERINRHTGQKEIVVQQVYNHYINDKQIDKFGLASNCKDWRLNDYLCNREKSYYLDEYIFLWAKSDPAK